MPGGVIGLVTTALTTLGVGAETSALLAPVLAGAGEGALSSWATGGDPLKGAAMGGITGGFAGDLGPMLSSATGIGQGLSGAITGAAGGALGSAITGSNAGTGAITGGISGLVQGLEAPGSSAAPTTATPSSAAAIGAPGAQTPGLAPAGGAATGATDLTNPIGQRVSMLSGGGGTDALRGGMATDTLGVSGAGGTTGTVSGASATPATGTAAAAPTSVEKFFDNPGLGTGWDVVKSNPGAVLETLGIAKSAFGGQPGDLKQLNAMAQRLNNQSIELGGYLNTGTLPPGAQAAVDRATRSAQANIKSTYGNLGLAGSTMEAQAINDAKMAAQEESFKIARDLLSVGVQESGISAEIFRAIMESNNAQDTALQNAIAGFAASMGGGPLPANFGRG